MNKKERKQFNEAEISKIFQEVFSNPLPWFYHELKVMSSYLNIIDQLSIIEMKYEENTSLEPSKKLSRITEENRKKFQDLFPNVSDDDEEEDFENEDNVIHGSDILLELLFYIYINLITVLEVFLEDRLKYSLNNHQNIYKNFIKNLNKKDIPKKWPNGKEITLYDYKYKMKKIIMDLILKYPYHDLNKTKYMYYNAYNFNIMDYPKIDMIMKYIKRRHKIVHRGKSIFIKMLFGQDGIKKMFNSLTTFELDHNIEDIYEFGLWLDEKASQAETTLK